LIQICEGAEGAFYPDVGYVLQGSKIWFAFGKDLHESSEDVQIVESIDDLDNVIEESDGKKYVENGIWFVEGIAQRSDTKNANGRRYPRAIWERILESADSPVQQTIAARGMIGHLEHPTDGRTDGTKGALVVTKAELQEDGIVWAKFELLDTPHGKILQEYTRKNVRWGVSSRGNGEVKEDGLVNESNYMLETWDAVMRPSTPGAYPTKSKAEPKKGKKTSEGLDDKSGLDDGNPEKVCLEGADALCQIVVEELTHGERVDFITKSLDALTGYDLDAERESFGSVFTKLMPKLGEAITDLSLDAAIQAGIDEATDQAEDRGTREAAFARAVAGLQSRLDAAVEESETSDARASELEEAMGSIEEERDQLKTEVDQLKDRISDLEVQVEAATSTLVDIGLRESDDEDESGTKKLSTLTEEAQQAHVDAIQGLIEEDARLAPFQAFLEAVEPSGLIEAAILLARHLPAARLPTTAKPVPLNLPRGIVENDELPAKRTDSTQIVSESVKTTARVVSSMAASRK